MFYKYVITIVNTLKNNVFFAFTPKVDIVDQIVGLYRGTSCEIQWHVTGTRSKVYCHPLEEKGELFPMKDQWRSAGGTSEFDAERGNSIIRELWLWRRDLRTRLSCRNIEKKIPKSPCGKWSVP